MANPWLGAIAIREVNVAHWQSGKKKIETSCGPNGGGMLQHCLRYFFVSFIFSVRKKNHA